jgi:hypothetical protein
LPEFSGNRIVDIALLNNFVSEHLTWRNDAETALGGAAAAFVDWAVERETDKESAFANKLNLLLAGYGRRGRGSDNETPKRRVPKASAWHEEEEDDLERRADMRHSDSLKIHVTQQIKINDSAKPT